MLASVAVEWPMECELLQLVSAGSDLAAQHLNSEARREICLNLPAGARCCRTFHATQQFTIQQPSPTAVAVEGTCTMGMFGHCSWTTFKTPTFLQLSSSPPYCHPSVCPQWCPQMSAPGCPGWGRGPSAQTRTSHQPGADTSY